MKQTTIRDAAVEALKRSGKPLSAKAIYSLIIKEWLYSFNAKNPESILSSVIRKHCDGINMRTAKSDKSFKILPEGTYWIKELPIPQKSS